MATLGDLVVNLAANARPLTSGLNKAAQSIRSFATSAVKTFTTVTTAATAGFSVMAVKLAADAEQTKISFEVMTGSAEKAGKLIADLRTMGAKTPFEFTDLANSTKTLLNFGRSGDQVLQDLDLLSNVAAGDAQKLQSLALVFGQISANGRLTGGDLLQLVNTGFNPLNQIAAKTGETMTQLRDRMSKGQIGFQEVRQAFVDATSAGGLFYKMNEKQSKTLLGQWSTLKDEVTGALIQLGESIVKNLDLKSVVANVSRMVTVFKEEWIPAIEEVIKLAPRLIEAFGEIGKGVGNVTGRIDDWIAAWERLTLVAGGIASGTAPEDLAQTMKEMGLVQQKGVIPIEARTGGKTLADIMPHTAERKRQRELENQRDQFAAAEEAKAFQAKLDKLRNPAGRMLADIVSDGLMGMEKGLMSLGPAAKEAGPRKELGSLEAGSREAFEVMRANVGAPEKDVQKNQLKALEKIVKLQEKMEKHLGRPLTDREEADLVIKNID